MEKLFNFYRYLENSGKLLTRFNKVSKSPERQTQSEPKRLEAYEIWNGRPGLTRGLVGEVCLKVRGGELSLLRPDFRGNSSFDLVKDLPSMKFLSAPLNGPGRNMCCPSPFDFKIFEYKYKTYGAQFEPIICKAKDNSILQREPVVLYSDGSRTALVWFWDWIWDGIQAKLCFLIDRSYKYREDIVKRIHIIFRVELQRDEKELGWHSDGTRQVLLSKD